MIGSVTAGLSACEGRLSVIRLIAVALASWFAFATEGEIAQDDDTLEWLDNYDEALALAKEMGRPIFLEFRCAP
jgi:hypothetical protein